MQLLIVGDNDRADDVKIEASIDESIIIYQALKYYAESDYVNGVEREITEKMVKTFPTITKEV